MHLLLKKILDPPLEGKLDLVVDQDQQDASMIRCSVWVKALKTSDQAFSCFLFF